MYRRFDPFLDPPQRERRLLVKILLASSYPNLEDQYLFSFNQLLPGRAHFTDLCFDIKHHNVSLARLLGQKIFPTDLFNRPVNGCVDIRAVYFCFYDVLSSPVGEEDVHSS